jgi:hypothetical protein
MPEPIDTSKKFPTLRWRQLHVAKWFREGHGLRVQFSGTTAFIRITSGSDIREGLRREDRREALIWRGLFCVGCGYPAVSGGPWAGGMPGVISPYYRRSSASIRGSVFLFPVDGSGQDARATVARGSCSPPYMPSQAGWFPMEAWRLPTAATGRTARRGGPWCERTSMK